MNKPLKRQSNFEHNYAANDYLMAMKQFMIKTRGVRKGTPEYEAIRNEIYSDLRTQKAINDAQKIKDAGGHSKAIDQNFKAEGAYSDYYSLLIVAPEEVDSYECVHVLNYFNFPFNLEEDNILKPLVKKEMGFSSEDGYPCLMIESSKEEIPNLDLSGTDIILGELR